MEEGKTPNDRDGRRISGEDVTFGKPTMLLVFEAVNFGSDNIARLFTGRLSEVLTNEEDCIETPDDRSERRTNDEVVIFGELVSFAVVDRIFADKTAKLLSGTLSKALTFEDGSPDERSEDMLEETFEADA